MNELPIRQKDADRAAKEFRRHWDASALVERGIEGLVSDVLHKLQDSGDVLLLTVDEATELHDYLEERLVVSAAWEDDPNVKPELASAIKKLSFLVGRSYGLVNADMAIKEEDTDER